MIKMEEEKEKTWAWLMPSGKIYKVVTNPGVGTIEVYDEDRKLVSKEEKLSEEAVNLLEKIFLETAASEVGGKEMEKGEGTEDNLGIAMYIR
jgi:hypothetical protein